MSTEPLCVGGEITYRGLLAASFITWVRYGGLSATGGSRLKHLLHLPWGLAQAGPRQDTTNDRMAGKQGAPSQVKPAFLLPTL